MAPQIISVVGNLGVDLIMVTNQVPVPGETLEANSYHIKLGGKGGNSAIAAQRCSHIKPQNVRQETEAEERSTQPRDADVDEGIEVQMVGAVGTDEYGKMYRKALVENGVKDSGVRVVEGDLTTVMFIIVEADTGENRILFAPNAMKVWQREDFETVEGLAHGSRPDLVISQLEIKREVVERMIETAGKAGIDFMLNAAPANQILSSCYQYITHLLVNETEAARLSGRLNEEVNESSWDEIAQEFLSAGVKNVVITLGEQGAYYANAKGHGHVLAYRVAVVDATGAGDTFNGCYASEYLRQKRLGQWDIRSAVERACKACALTIGKLGAQDGIPWSDEIDAFKGEHISHVLRTLEIADEATPVPIEEEQQAVN